MFEVKSKLQMQEGQVLLVDALNLAFRYMHRKQLDFKEDYIATIHSIARSYQCSDIILTSDRGTSSYRKTLLPSYKENRKEKRKDQSEEDKAFFTQFFSNFTEMLEELSKSKLVFVTQGVEADDIAAYIVGKRQEFGLRDIWLLSSDKDWDLLISDRVSRFSYITRKEVTAENWFDHYNVPMCQYLDFKILAGDTGDNVPGIRGIGPKRAQSLLENYGSCKELYEALPIDSKYVYIKNLNAGADILPLNEKLFNIVDHCKEAIGEYTEEIDAAFRQRQTS